MEPCFALIECSRISGSRIGVVGGRAEMRLDAVAHGELAFDLSVDADACETAGIVGCEFLVRFLDRELICCWVDHHN